MSMKDAVLVQSFVSLKIADFFFCLLFDQMIFDQTSKDQ